MQNKESSKEGVPLLVGAAGNTRYEENLTRYNIELVTDKNPWSDILG